MRTTADRWQPVLDLPTLSDAELATLLGDLSPAAMCMVDADGRIARANAAAIDLLAPPAGDVVGRSLDQLVPADRLSRRTRRVADQRGRPFDLVALAPVGHEAADAADRALEALTFGIALYDAADRLVRANRTARLMLPEIAHLLVPGAVFRDLLRAAEAAGVTALADAATNATLERLASGAPFDADVEIERADGAWLRSSVRRIAGGGMLHVLMDVTEAKERERAVAERQKAFNLRESQLEAQSAQLADLAEELDAARIEAERASRTKSEFLATVSHELRTPLNAVIGFSEVLSHEMFGPLGNPRYREYAADIRDSAAHLLSLINDILDLSKAEAGHMVVEPEAIDPTELIQECLRVLRPHAERAGVDLVADLPPFGCTIQADRRKLKQVLLNLGSNGIKFTLSGGQVTFGASDRPEGGLRLWVADTGIGIAPDDVERALKPFVQVGSDIGRSRGGTGLGLPLSRQLVELHGGRLDVQSVLGKGTTVWIDLPPRPTPAAA